MVQPIVRGLSVVESTRQLKENQSHLHQRKKLSQELRSQTKGKVATKSPVKETNWRKCTPRKVTDSATSPQTLQVQSQLVSPAESAMAVSPSANVVTSQTQPAATPHPASLAIVFKKMVDAAEMNKTIVSTNGQI